MILELHTKFQEQKWKMQEVIEVTIEIILQQKYPQKLNAFKEYTCLLQSLVEAPLEYGRVNLRAGKKRQ